MRYTTIHNVKKSIYDAFVTKLPEVLPEFPIPDKLKILDSYPNDPDAIDLPSIVFDISSLEIRTPYDLGSEARYRVNFGLDIFARDNYEREILAGTIIDLLEKNVIILYNYNMSPPQEVGYLVTTDIDATPRRFERPDFVGEHIFSISFTVEWRQKY